MARERGAVRVHILPKVRKLCRLIGLKITNKFVSICYISVGVVKLVSARFSYLVG